MCVITSDADQAYPDVDGVIISSGLPVGLVCSCTVTQAEYSVLFPVQVGDGALYATDSSRVDPSYPMDAFTIVYPID